MNIQTRKKDWLFLLGCLGLGLLAEISFFHGRIGISYIIFIAAFYLLLFLRFGFSFEHRRIGLLLMVGIWLLAGGYLYQDSTVFRYFNIFIIPVIIIFQIVLVTSPKNLNWSRLSFLKLVTGKLMDAFQYLVTYLSVITRRILRRNKKESTGLIRQVILGILLALPILFIVVSLLMAADDRFSEVMRTIFFFRLEWNVIDLFFRAGFVLVMGLFFFCVFQVLGRKTKRKPEVKVNPHKPDWPEFVAATILIIMNIVYILFIAVEFSYFFQIGLEEGFTYATYARRGFFELLLVTLINWTMLITFMKRVSGRSSGLRVLLNVLYSALILSSGLILLSAYQRLSLYETMYGYTIDRLLAHSFMLFLFVIFAYTLIRVWLEHLSILHFYLISAFLFYITLNTVNIEEMIVENNLERYEETGKIDIHYLDGLGAEGVKGLVTLYEKEPDSPQLNQLLKEKAEQVELMEEESWQSYNFKREEAKERLEEWHENYLEVEQ